MKVMVCGSMSFAKEMLESKANLEELGHSAEIPPDTEMVVGGLHNHDDLDEDYKHCIENNIMQECFKKIEESDAVLILNYPKNGVDGYIGTASLMEIGIASHLGKKVFLLNEPPRPDRARWAHEVRILKPVVLNGDLGKIR